MWRTTCGPAFPASIGSWPAAGDPSPRPSRSRPPRSTAPAFTRPGPRWTAPSASVWCSRSVASLPRSSRWPATTPRCIGAGPHASGAPPPCCEWATRRPPRPGWTSIAARSPTSPAAWPGPLWPPGIRCFGHSWRRNPREPAVRRSATRLYAGSHALAQPGGRTPRRPGAALRGGAVRDRGTRPRHAPRPARATERRWALVGAGGAPGHRLPVCVGSGDRAGPQRARAPDVADAARRGPHRWRDRRRPRPRRRVSGARPRTHHGVAGRLRRGGVDHRRQVARALQAARGSRVRGVLSGRHPRLLLARRARRRGDPDPLETGVTPSPSRPAQPSHAALCHRVNRRCPLPPARSLVDERELIAKVRAGDGAAERALYDAHVDRVYRLAYRLAGDDELARGFTQDTFVRAFDRLGAFRGEAKLSTWLHAIATSVVLNGLRKVKRVRQRETDLDEAAGTSAGRRAAEPDLKRRLAQAIDGLPDGYRMVFVMHDVEGYTHDEIGAALGIETGTSKAQLSRARAKLRDALADFAGEWTS